MSDTDDTDDLLLIPPDFFLLDSDSGDSNFIEPYYNIVDNLIQQVSDLKYRIDSIESVSLSNPLDYWFDHPDNMQSTTSRFQKYNSIDDLYIPQSTQSTPQKPHTKFKLSSLPNSPNVDKFSPSKNIKFKSPIRVDISPRNTKRSSPAVSPSPEKNDSQMLGEIDKFLSKVRTIQRINAVRNIERDFTDGSDARNTPQNTPNKEIHQLLTDFNCQERKNSELNKAEKELTMNKDIVKEHTWRQGDNKESVPNYGLGVRETLYRNHNESQGDYNRQHQSIQNHGRVPNNSWGTTDLYSDSSSELTHIATYDRNKKDRGDLLTSPIHTNALNVLNMHKQLLEDEAKKLNTKTKTREPKTKGANIVSDNLGLLSLADIWSTNPPVVSSNPSQLSQKLQEEKLRRQHCEDLIQDLQNRNLEMQQKLSVALKVDEAKNSTIQQFQEVLEKIVTRLEKLNTEKQEWDQERAKLKSTHSKEMEEASQKIGYYEREASKALNLAHGNQDKLSSLEKRCSDLQNELQSLENKCRDIQEDYGKESERNKHLSEILSQKEIELNENKSILNDARAEVAQSKRVMEVCQAEFTGLKNECVKLQNDLKDEREQNIQLNEQKRTLLNDIEGHKRREEELKAERDKLKKQLENSKLELRNFYQGQVEILVQNKLKEFQSQLDRAETAFKEEIKKREMSIAKTAATHIQQISEKYSMEINLLEKKHEEEIKLYQIQVMQQKQQAESLQYKVDQMQEKRVKVAKQLQKIMESQWTEALRIITSGKSPTFNEEAFSTIDQLNSLKTRSYNNVEEVLAQQQEEQYNVRKPKNETAFSLPNEDTMSSVSNHFEKHLQDGYALPEDTPVSSRNQGGKPYNENEIQKYIYLLLNRPPGNPTEEGQQRANEKPAPDTVTDRASWQHVDEASTNKSTSKENLKERRYLKPPWK